MQARPLRVVVRLGTWLMLLTSPFGFAAGSGTLTLEKSTAPVLSSPTAVVAAPPVITGIDPASCINPGKAITVRGSNFGSASGRLLRITGNGVNMNLKHSSWTNTAIAAPVPGAGLQAGRSYNVGIINSSTGKWLSNTDRTFSLCGGISSLSATVPPSAVKTPEIGGTPLVLTPQGRIAPPPPPSTIPEPEADWGNNDPGTYDTGTSGGAPTGGGSLLGGGLPPPPQDLPPVAAKDDETLEPGELVAVSSSMREAQELAQQAQGLGLGIKRRSNLSGLGFVVTVLRVPKGMTVGDALVALRQLAPNAWADANHRYALQAGDEQRYAATLIGWQPATSRCGNGARIGMIDTDIDSRHPLLSGRRLTTRSMLPAGVRSAPPDHGTATAALLIGNSDASGFAGLMPEANLYAANVFRGRGRKDVDTTAEWIVVALDWLAGQKVQVINLSLGGPRNLLVEAAVQRLLDRGVAMVAAAGNGGPSAPPVYPAAQAGVIATTAVDAKLKVYRKANHGDYIQFAAPGVDIWTAAPGKGGVYVSGTSYATPFVTAALTAAGGRPKAVKQLERKSRDLGDPGRDPVYGAGLIQAQAACGSSQVNSVKKK